MDSEVSTQNYIGNAIRGLNIFWKRVSRARRSVATSLLRNNDLNYKRDFTRGGTIRTRTWRMAFLDWIAGGFCRFYDLATVSIRGRSILIFRESIIARVAWPLPISIIGVLNWPITDIIVRYWPVLILNVFQQSLMSQIHFRPIIKEF